MSEHAFVELVDKMGGDLSPRITRGELPCAGAALEEVARPLDRHLVVPFTHLKGPAFDVLLVVDAGERVLARHVAELDRDDQSAVGERRVVATLTHAVGAEVPGIADAGHDVTARAHAEGEEITATGMSDE